MSEKANERNIEWEIRERKLKEEMEREIKKEMKLREEIIRECKRDKPESIVHVKEDRRLNFHLCLWTQNKNGKKWKRDQERESSYEPKLKEE